MSRDRLTPPGRTMPTERDQGWIQPGPPAKTLLQVIEDALRDPDPCSSVEQFKKLYHAAAAALSLDDLDDERLRLRFARAFHLITEWASSAWRC